MFSVLISLWRILFLWIYSKPMVICIKNFQIFYSFNDFLFCIFKYIDRSPLSQYSITMWSVSFYMKESLYWTMKGWFSFPMIVAYINVYKLRLNIYAFFIFLTHFIHTDLFHYTCLFIAFINCFEYYTITSRSKSIFDLKITHFIAHWLLLTSNQLNIFFYFF